MATMHKHKCSSTSSTRFLMFALFFFTSSIATATPNLSSFFLPPNNRTIAFPLSTASPSLTTSRLVVSNSLFSI
ncbi:hypothetical protein IC582_004619 [Cucumis melo]